MSKRKKLLLTIVASVVVIGGILGGTAVAFADDEDVDQEQTLLERVAEIYEANTGTTIDADQLETAVQQAREERQLEARDAMFDKLIEEGMLTQEEADEYKAWLDARPDIDIDMPLLNGHFGKILPELKEHSGRIHDFMLKLRGLDKTDTADTQ